MAWREVLVMVGMEGAASAATEAGRVVPVARAAMALRPIGPIALPRFFEAAMLATADPVARATAEMAEQVQVAMAQTVAMAGMEQMDQVVRFPQRDIRAVMAVLAELVSAAQAAQEMVGMPSAGMAGQVVQVEMEALRETAVRQIRAGRGDKAALVGLPLREIHRRIQATEVMQQVETLVTAAMQEMCPMEQTLLVLVRVLVAA